MIAALWCALSAQAHPFGARFAAHLMELEVGREGVRVQYLADVPNPLVATATSDRGADPLPAMANELRSGLLLEVDGTSIPLEPDGVWTVTPTEDTHQFSWTFTAAIPPGSTSVEVSNANLPDVTAVYRSRVTVADGLVATACSLWRMRGDELAIDETDRWRTDERNRTLSVEIQEPLGTFSPLWLTVFPPPATPPIAAEARTVQPDPRWIGGGVVAVVLVFFGLGLAAQRVRRSASAPATSSR